MANETAFVVVPVEPPAIDELDVFRIAGTWEVGVKEIVFFAFFLGIVSVSSAAGGWAALSGRHCRWHSCAEYGNAGLYLFIGHRRRRASAFLDST